MAGDLAAREPPPGGSTSKPFSSSDPEVAPSIQTPDQSSPFGVRRESCGVATAAPAYGAAPARSGPNRCLDNLPSPSGRGGSPPAPCLF